MKTKILLFGVIAEIVGEKELEVQNISDTEALQNFLFQKYPRLKNQQFVLAAGAQILFGKTTLSGISTVAILPPFAGG